MRPYPGRLAICPGIALPLLYVVFISYLRDYALVWAGVIRFEYSGRAVARAHDILPDPE